MCLMTWRASYIRSYLLERSDCPSVGVSCVRIAKRQGLTHDARERQVMQAKLNERGFECD